MEYLAPAKLNLCLDVLGRTPSGYHEIQTVFQADYTFADEIKIYEVRETNNESIAGEGKNQVPKNENLAFKALQLVKKEFGIDRHVEIEIKKHIPLSAGLGGGSSDAATVIKALNDLWKLGQTKEQLALLAAPLGCDVPFFIYGGTALGAHFGEKITPLPRIECVQFLPQIPKNHQTIPNKTEQMYASLDLSKCGQNKAKTQALIQAIKDKEASAIIANLHNDFETLLPVPENYHLSGSGPAIFTATHA